MKQLILATILLAVICTNANAQGTWSVDQITSNTANDFRPRIDVGEVWWWEQASSTNVIGGLEVGQVLKNGTPAPLTDYNKVFLYDWDVRGLMTAHVVSGDYPSTATTSFYVNDVLTTRGISFAEAETQTVEGHYLNWVEVRGGHAWASSAYQDYDEGSGQWLDLIMGLVRNDRYVKLWSTNQGFITPPLNPTLNLSSSYCVGFWGGQAVYVVTVLDEFGEYHSRFYFEDGSVLSGAGSYGLLGLAQIDDDLLVFDAEPESGSGPNHAYAYNLASSQLEVLSAGALYGGFGPVTKNGNIAWFELEDFDNYLVAKIGGVRTARIVVETVFYDHLDIEGNAVVWAEDKTYPPVPGSTEIYRATWQGPSAVGGSWRLYE